MSIFYTDNKISYAEDENDNTIKIGLDQTPRNYLVKPEFDANESIVNSQYNINRNTNNSTSALANNLTEIQSVILDYTTSGAVTKGDVCEFSGSNMTPVSGNRVWQYDGEEIGIDSTMESESIYDVVKIIGTDFIAIASIDTASTDKGVIRLFNIVTKEFSANTYTISYGNPVEHIKLVCPKSGYLAVSYKYFYKFYVATFTIAIDGTISYITQSSTPDMSNYTLKVFQKYDSNTLLIGIDSNNSATYFASFYWDTTYYKYIGMQEIRWSSKDWDVGTIYAFNKNSNYYLMKRSHGDIYKSYIPVNSGVLPSNLYMSNYSTFLGTLGYSYNNHIISSCFDAQNNCYFTTRYTEGTDNNTYLYKNSTQYIYASTRVDPYIQPKYSGILLTESANSVYRIYNSDMSYTNMSQLSVILVLPYASSIGYSDDYDFYLFYYTSNRFRCRYFSKPIVYNYDDAVAIAQENLGPSATGKFRLLRASDIDTTRTDLTTGTKYYNNIGLAVSPTQLYIIKDISDIIT